MSNKFKATIVISLAFTLLFSQHNLANANNNTAAEVITTHNQTILEKQKVNSKKLYLVDVNKEINIENYNAKYTYKIANNKIAKINSGKIKGLKKGYTNITVETDSQIITQKIQVIKKVSKLKVTYNKNMYVKDTQKIKVKALPKSANNKKVKFINKSKKNIKLFKNGKIKALKKGTATIIIKSKDGNVKKKIKINIKEKSIYKNNDLRLLSSIIFSEAGNQCYAGKKAVGIVVKNRQETSKFPNSIKEVIYQSGQFTPARNGSLNNSLSKYDNGTLNKDCIKAAKEVLSGDKSVNYNGKSINLTNFYFFSGYVAGCRLQIQGHQFK